jgi:hypothetical protein
VPHAVIRPPPLISLAHLTRLLPHTPGAVRLHRLSPLHLQPLFPPFIPLPCPIPQLPRGSPNRPRRPSIRFLFSVRFHPRLPCRPPAVPPPGAKRLLTTHTPGNSPQHRSLLPRLPVRSTGRWRGACDLMVQVGEWDEETNYWAEGSPIASVAFTYSPIVIPASNLLAVDADTLQSLRMQQLPPLAPQASPPKPPQHRTHWGSLHHLSQRRSPPLHHPPPGYFSPRPSTSASPSGCSSSPLILVCSWECAKVQLPPLYPPPPHTHTNTHLTLSPPSLPPPQSWEIQWLIASVLSPALPRACPSSNHERATQQQHGGILLIQQPRCALSRPIHVAFLTPPPL